MSSKTSINGKSSAELQVELAVYGFIHELEKLLSSNTIIPITVIDLCYNFYRNIDTFIILCKDTEVTIANLNDKSQVYDLNFKQIKNNQTPKSLNIKYEMI